MHRGHRFVIVHARPSHADPPHADPPHADPSLADPSHADLSHARASGPGRSRGAPYRATRRCPAARGSTSPAVVAIIVVSVGLAVAVAILGVRTLGDAGARRLAEADRVPDRIVDVTRGPALGGPGVAAVLGTRATITSGDGTIQVIRDLPNAAFALEAGQTLHPLIPPDAFEVTVDTVFRPRQDAQGFIAAELLQAQLLVERVLSRRSVAVHSDAATGRRLATQSTVITTLSRDVEHLRWTLRHPRPGPMVFVAQREPYGVSTARPIDAAGMPIRPADDDPAGDAWPTGTPLSPIDALAEALQRGSCTDCHRFHAAQPFGRTAAPDLAVAARRTALDDLAAAIRACAGRAATAGLPFPPITADEADAVGRLLAQSAGRLPSSERAAPEAALEAAPVVAPATASETTSDLAPRIPAEPASP